MDVELPDGTIIEDVPEGTTKSQLMAKLKAGGYDVSKLAPSGGFRFASPETEQAGVGAIGRAAQAAEEFFTKPVAPAPANVMAQGYDPMAAYAERVVGNIPRDITNIGQGMRELPATARALYARPLETLGAAGAGMLQGAGQFLTSPAETFAEAPISTLTGLQAANFLRAPSRLTMNVLQEKATPLLRNAFSPKNRFLGETFGAPEVQNALAAAQPGMSVPQALADVNAPVAQAVAEQALKMVPTEARRAALAQEQARAGRMTQIAGTPEDLTALEQARSAEAAANYGRAFKQIMPETPEIAAILGKPSMRAAFTRAAQIAKERGRPFQIGETKPASVVESSIVDEFGQPFRREIPAETAQYPVESLHYVKMALDDMIRDPKDFGIGATEVAAIKETRKKFLDQLKNNDAYNNARVQYAAQSIPINRMQIAQELQRAMTEPVTEGATRAGMFARAVEGAPKTIKRATGQQFFDRLEDILEPSEMKVVNDIREEFRRNQLAKEQATLGRAASDDVAELASARVSPSLNIPFLNRTWTIANTVLKRTLGKIDDKLAVEIGMNMLDPRELAKAVDAAKKYASETEAMTERVRKKRRGMVKALPKEAASFGVSFQNAMTPENRNAMAR